MFFSIDRIMKLTVIPSLLAIQSTYAFSVQPAGTSSIHRTTALYSETISTSTTEEGNDETKAIIDPKELVKLFGRLADKYILLDSSGGMCCYSACSDCEYRLPGGGYRMAEQSSSRPKWVVAYDERSFESSGKQHTSKWGIDLFGGKDGSPRVTKEEFMQRMKESKFNPPLGGPYLSASSATIEDDSSISQLWDILVPEGKEVLTKHRMGTKIKELAGGEEGMVWNDFMKAFDS